MPKDNASPESCIPFYIPQLYPNLWEKPTVATMMILTIVMDFPERELLRLTKTLIVAVFD